MWNRPTLGDEHSAFPLGHTDEVTDVGTCQVDTVENFRKLLRQADLHRSHPITNRGLTQNRCMKLLQGFDQPTQKCTGMTVDRGFVGQGAILVPLGIYLFIQAHPVNLTG